MYIFSTFIASRAGKGKGAELGRKGKDDYVGIDILHEQHKPGKGWKFNIMKDRTQKLSKINGL